MTSSALDTTKIKGIIWDLDNTLYRFDDAFEKACNIASARAAIDMGVQLSLNEAIVVAESSFEKHGYSGLIFEREYNICFKDYHFKYHDAIDEKIIEANEDMKAELGRLNLPHVILTNASRRWARRVIAHLGLDPWFPDEAIIAQEDSEFTPKARGPRGFEIALEKLGLPCGEILMVDDMTKNLRIPKDMGLQTALIHHGKKHDAVPDFVDAEFPDTLALMQAFHHPDRP
ncbi:MAG: HAD family hydrolase [Pseudomonadota bacterium]